MAEYRLSNRADDDLREVWRSIASENERAADALLLRILEKLELAATQPRMGSARPEIGPNVRILIEGQYIVIYEPTPYGVLALAIVHGARDPEH